MEKVFDDMKNQSKNNVDNIVQWFKDAKIIEATQEGENKVRALFAGADQNNIQLEKFQEVVKKLATEQKKPLDDVSKQLAAEGQKFMQNIIAGVSALKDQLTFK